MSVCVSQSVPAPAKGDSFYLIKLIFLLDLLVSREGGNQTKLINPLIRAERGEEEISASPPVIQTQASSHFKYFLIILLQPGS